MLMSGINYSNTMSSTFFSFVRKFWYASIKTVAVYIILYLCTYALFKNSESTRAVYWVFSALCLVLYIFCCYVDIWRKALRDFNLVKYEYITYNKYRGLLAGLVADIPGLIVIILILVTQAAGAASYVDVFKVAYFALYSPFVMLVSTFSGNILYFLPLIIPPVAGALAYHCGYHNIGLVAKFMYNTDRAKNKKFR